MLDTDNDLMISIIESIAQAENESRSENIRMGLAMRAANGTSGLYKRKLYGYIKNEDGDLVINNEQAKVVRDVFRWYLDGTSVLGIIKKLSDAGVPSATGKETWSKRSIEKILENEKYTGTVTLDRKRDFLLRRNKYKKVGNQAANGEVAHTFVVTKISFRQHVIY